MFKPRPDQERILDYVRTGGRMGVSAVPGSGKTVTLSFLAAQLVRGRIRGAEEVLIVTFMNSAVNAFSSRIREFLGQEGMLPGVGYRVRTLHGLGNDIVRERPALVGLSEDFSIIDERAAFQILEDAATGWVRAQPHAHLAFLSETLTDAQRARAERKGWPDLVRDAAGAFIRRAKDLRLSPEAVALRLGDAGEDRSLCRMGVEVYADYQRALAHRGAVDFDDLIGLAVDALRTDPGLLGRLRARWPYVLEDEAQDSSELQERILRLLTEGGNWVRVGDPNQAINTTFTTSDTRFLRRFLEEPGTDRRELSSSGRSARRIVDAANGLVDWAVSGHPHPVVRGRAFVPQHIRPVPGPSGGWPQNPEDLPDHRVVFHPEAYSPERELERVVGSIARWLPDHRDRTVAVLVPDNRRGAKVVEALRRQEIESDELLRSTATIRLTAERLVRVLSYLAEPLDGVRLSQLYESYARFEEEGAADEEGRAVHGNILRELRRCRTVEALLWPAEEADGRRQTADGEKGHRSQVPGPKSKAASPGPETWDRGLETQSPGEEMPESLIGFLAVVRRWLEASVLPADQLVLTVAQELFRGEAPGVVSRDLAIAHKIASLLRSAAVQNPDWRLGELTEEVGRIANNEGHFIRFEEDEAGYSPTPGRVTVSTMHKAKGLEWDRVYLLGLNSYDFPSASPGDVYRGEEWFIRDGLNLVAEATAQLEAMSRGDGLQEGDASRESRLRYVEERLRLLYVGITRARRELIVTTNRGNREEDPRPPALALTALRDFMTGRGDRPVVPASGPEA